MLNRIYVGLMLRMQEATRRPDRGLETLEYVLWAAGIIVVIGALIVLLRSKLESFWNSLNFGSVA